MEPAKKQGSEQTIKAGIEQRDQARKQCSKHRSSVGSIEADKEAMFRAEHRMTQCSEHRSRQRSSVPSIEAGKEAMFRAEHRSSVPSKEEDGTARNLGIWAMQSIHVFRAAEIIGSSEHGDLGYAANTCVFRAAEIIGSSEPAWFAW